MPETFAYSVAEDHALATLRAVFASPITFVDTAASYGDGESERRIGVVLEEMGGIPPGYVLATKADRDLRSGDFGGAQMRRSVERSLRLLGLDRPRSATSTTPSTPPSSRRPRPGGRWKPSCGSRTKA
jgi:D-threo-aldose 1-dehydrogenase